MSSIDPARFRQVLGHYPTGVTIVTGIGPAGPVGATIGSFTSVSLDPPLVGFLPMSGSVSWQAMAESGSFCVNVLSSEQDELCWRFAKSGNGDKFADVAWEPAGSGSPILGGAVAWIDCAIESVTEMGDHLFVLGRVVALDHADNGAEPSIFFKGKLRSLDALEA